MLSFGQPFPFERPVVRTSLHGDGKLYISRCFLVSLSLSLSITNLKMVSLTILVSALTAFASSASAATWYPKLTSANGTTVEVGKPFTVTWVSPKLEITDLAHERAEQF